MTGEKAMVEDWRRIGYLPTTEVCELIGREHGGNIHGLLEKHGVRYVKIPHGKGDRYLYHRDDLNKVPPVAQPTVEGRLPNGGQQLAQIVQNRKRIEKLEAELAKLQEFRASLED